MADNDTEAWLPDPTELRHPREPSNAAGQLHVSSFESKQRMEEHGGAGASSAATETRCVPHQGPLSLAEKSAQEWADEEIGSLPLLRRGLRRAYRAGDTRWARLAVRD